MVRSSSIGYGTRPDMSLSISRAPRARMAAGEVAASWRGFDAGRAYAGWIVRAAALLVLFTAIGSAQTRGGRLLSGVVVDATGAVLPFAEVQLADPSGQIVAAITTDQ